MKSHDEIKKGLECCIAATCPTENGCPYRLSRHCGTGLKADALALIQQLQADNAQLNRCIENMTDKLNAMNDEVAKLQSERDAAVKDIEFDGACEVCKHIEKDVGEPPCNHCFHVNKGQDSYFEWRGVQKEE